MANDGLRYEQMMESAMRGVMREALIQVAESGLPGQHHFYISFRTEYPGVEIPPKLAQKYPREMTIVLQYQFWGLAVFDDHFKVTLSFDKNKERLVVPFAAVTSFVDPSVQFALQFPGSEPPAVAATEPTPPTPPTPPADPKPPAEGDDRVVRLDTFRKK
ncbi:MAG: hypothetical protein JNK67_28225 [Alphaproteobacteria bacterium]|nr:hypothetical protein [Alphaproteobacteria bacterium]